MFKNDELEEEKKEDAISDAISEKIIEKTTLMIEQKKNECQAIIDNLKQESINASQNLEIAVQKLKILHEGSKDKVASLDKQYHDALANITIINAKLESLNSELNNKLTVVEKGFLRLFETDEQAKSNIENFQSSLANDRKLLNFLVKKVFGTPFDEDEENKKSFVYRLIYLENDRVVKDKKIAELFSKIEAMQIEIRTLKTKTSDVEQKTIVHKLEKTFKPIRKVLDELAVAIAKSIMIKLLLGALLALGLLHTFESYINLIIDDLF